jgi:hypothetical protein
VFPTATSKFAGQGAWQAGPAFAAVYTGVPRMLIGFLLQNPISFAYTSPDRLPQNTLAFQPVALLSFWDGWYLRSANATWPYGWRRHSPSLLPLSLGVGRVMVRPDLPPLNFYVSGQWMAYHQNSPITSHWSVNFGVTIAFSQFGKRWTEVSREPATARKLITDPGTKFVPFTCKVSAVVAEMRSVVGGVNALTLLDLRYAEVDEAAKRARRGKKKLISNDDYCIPTRLETDSPETTASRPPKVSRWKAIFSPAQRVPTYEAAWLRSDVLADITLGAYALPEGVAYASLASLPIALIVVILGGS